MHTQKEFVADALPIGNHEIFEVISQKLVMSGWSEKRAWACPVIEFSDPISILWRSGGTVQG